jgi:hypothetical protein
MSEFPKVRLENKPSNDDVRFELTIRDRNPTIESDGSIRIWLDRGDVSNLSFDCSTALLDDDVERGEVE